jgi:hypothetical protein
MKCSTRETASASAPGHPKSSTGNILYVCPCGFERNQNVDVRPARKYNGHTTMLRIARNHAYYDCYWIWILEYWVILSLNQIAEWPTTAALSYRCSGHDTDKYPALALCRRGALALNAVALIASSDKHAEHVFVKDRSPIKSRDPGQS